VPGTLGVELSGPNFCSEYLLNIPCKTNQLINWLNVFHPSIEQFMSLSLAAEPRRKGLFEPFYWSQHSPTQPLPHPLIPLLFPQPLPVITLIDRGEILRRRMESGVSNLNGTDLQFLRSLEPRLNDRQSSGNKVTLPGLGGDLLGSIIAVYNGELLLVIQTGAAEPTPVPSRASSLAPSRPHSTADEIGCNEQRISRTPSIRVKTGPLERKLSVARRSSLPAISQRPLVVTAESSSEPPLRVLVHAGTVDRLVDILVHGLQGVSVSVADDNGEMSLREGKTRDLTVNHTDFARVWWSVFRSFVTPLAFFEVGLLFR
jgi:GTPase-activating protein BEM2